MWIKKSNRTKKLNYIDINFRVFLFWKKSRFIFLFSHLAKAWTKSISSETFLEYFEKNKTEIRWVLNMIPDNLKFS